MNDHHFLCLLEVGNCVAECSWCRRNVLEQVGQTMLDVEAPIRLQRYPDCEGRGRRTFGLAAQRALLHVYADLGVNSVTGPA